MVRREVQWWARFALDLLRRRDSYLAASRFVLWARVLRQPFNAALWNQSLLERISSERLPSLYVSVKAGGATGGGVAPP
jgi:hypothetical protein